MENQSILLSVLTVYFFSHLKGSILISPEILVI